MFCEIVWPYNYTAPVVWTEPEPGSPEAFREDEFVSLWNEMYTLLFKLNFWRREDMHFPSAETGRHTNLDRERLLVEKGMSLEAVSLLERLPYPCANSWRRRLHIYHDAIAINYLNPEDIQDCRDPLLDTQYFPEANAYANDGNYLLPQDVTLAIPYEAEGLTWILDLKHSA